MEIIFQLLILTRFHESEDKSRQVPCVNSFSPFNFEIEDDSEPCFCSGEISPEGTGRGIDFIFLEV